MDGFKIHFNLYLKQIYEKHKWDSNRYNLTGSESNWE